MNDRRSDAPARDGGRSGPPCGYCHSATSLRAVGRTCHPLWECGCGALGSGSPFRPDLDEVAEGLLAVLDLEGGGAARPMPMPGTGAVRASRYDVPATLAAVARILAERGFESRPLDQPVEGRAHATIWIRRRA
ncbi:MAG: hypothetical protein ACKO3G_07000 [Planctomycetaceae bacterium]